MEWRDKPRLTVAMLGLIVVLVAVFLTLIRPINEYRAIAIAIRTARIQDPSVDVEPDNAAAEWERVGKRWKVTLHTQGISDLHYKVTPDGRCRRSGSIHRLV
jgi:hypothetical protein